MSIINQLRVLVVDDTTTSRMLIRDGLEQIGIKNVVLANDGQKALEFMMTTPAHLIISDVNMPRLDGLGLLKAIREFTPTRKVPFIILTGSAERSVLDAAIKLGVNNYLQKPFTAGSLKNAVEAVVGRLT